jgi:hypothetical protein
MSKFLSLVLPARAEVLPVVTNSKALTFADFNALVPDLDQGFFKAGSCVSSVHAGFLALSNSADFVVLLKMISTFLESCPTAKVYKLVLDHEQNFVWFTIYVTSSGADADKLAYNLHCALRLADVRRHGAYWVRETKGESLDSDTVVIANA